MLIACAICWNDTLCAALTACGVLSPRVKTHCCAATGGGPDVPSPSPLHNNPWGTWPTFVNLDLFQITGQHQNQSNLTTENGTWLDFSSLTLPAISNYTPQFMVPYFPVSSSQYALQSSFPLAIQERSNEKNSRPRYQRQRLPPRNEIDIKLISKEHRSRTKYKSDAHQKESDLHGYRLGLAAYIPKGPNMVLADSDKAETMATSLLDAIESSVNADLNGANESVSKDTFKESIILSATTANRNTSGVASSLFVAPTVPAVRESVSIRPPTNRDGRYASVKENVRAVPGGNKSALVSSLKSLAPLVSQEYRHESEELITRRELDAILLRYGLSNGKKAASATTQISSDKGKTNAVSFDGKSNRNVAFPQPSLLNAQELRWGTSIAATGLGLFVGTSVSPNLWLLGTVLGGLFGWETSRGVSTTTVVSSTSGTSVVVDLPPGANTVSRVLLQLGRRLALLYLSAYDAVKTIFFMYKTGQLSYAYYKQYESLDQKFEIQNKIDAWNSRFAEGALLSILSGIDLSCFAK
jgi:hypothetical protein